MVRNKAVVILALLALAGLQFRDCLSAIAHDQRSMQCCGSMSCDASNRNHDCCKAIASPQSPSVLATAKVTLAVSVIVAADIVPVPQSFAVSDASRSDFAAPQHSPPELYTLHSFYLI